MKLNAFKYLIILVFTSKIIFSQDTNIDDKVKIFHTGNKYNVNKIENFSKIKSDIHKIEEWKINENIDRVGFRFVNPGNENKYSFDLIKSVGSNISFGGFWDKYAVLNFTPNMYIKPLSFMSIYANNNLYCLIPLNGLKEHFQSITVQGLAVLAIDNSIKMMFPDNHWIPQLISFAAKKLLINILIKPSNKRTLNSPTPILEFENYYYSVSINF